MKSEVEGWQSYTVVFHLHLHPYSLPTELSPLFSGIYLILAPVPLCESRRMETTALDTTASTAALAPPSARVATSTAIPAPDLEEHSAYLQLLVREMAAHGAPAIRCSPRLIRQLREACGSPQVSRGSSEDAFLGLKTSLLN